MKVSEALARAVALEIGDTPVYSLIGDANLAIVGALRRYTGAVLRFARDEGAAVAMADGHAQASGSLGVASVTSGPGLTHAATSLLASSRMRTPLVVLAGDTPMRRPTGLQEMQNIDQRRFAGACEALFQELRSPETLADDILSAFHQARTRRLPVVLDVPLDLQSMEVPAGWTYRSSHSVSASRGPLPIDTVALRQLAALLAESKQPLLLAGRGAVRAGARAALEELAAKTGALLGTSLLAKGFFTGNPWSLGVVGGYSTPAGIDILKKVDVIVAFGAELGHFTTQAGTLFRGRRIVQIDTEPDARVLPRAPTLTIQADARAAAIALAEAIGVVAPRPGLRTAETAARLAAPWPPIPPIAGDLLDPRTLMLALGKSLPRNARLVFGGGHFWSFPCLYLDPPEGGDVLCPLGAAAVGQALPFAIGVAAASPNRPVVAIEGDGSLLMNIQELDTAARDELPIVLLVMNDGALSAERLKLKSEGYDPNLVIYPSPDFAAIARGFGWRAETLDGHGKIADLLHRRDWAAGPLLIDARISRDVIVDPVAIKDLGRA